MDRWLDVRLADGRPSATSLDREALRGWHEAGLPGLEAMTAIDMAILLDGTLPESRPLERRPARSSVAWERGHSWSGSSRLSATTGRGPIEDELWRAPRLRHGPPKG